MKKERTRGGGKYTEAGYFGLIRSILRRGFSSWPPKWQVLAAAKRPYKGTDKRKKFEYQCAKCENYYGGKEVSVDHKIPCGSLSSYDDLASFVGNLFCESEGLQVLCSHCHTQIKTPADRMDMKQQKNWRQTHPREEASYRNMMSRCSNINSTGYKYYGGRGISVCDSWAASFENFLADMGPRPDAASLDRINVDGNYCKENCRWASFSEQARNTTHNHVISYKDEEKLLCEWGEELGIIPNTILTRIRRGCNVGQALGLEEKPIPLYKGRLSDGDLEFIKDELNKGTSTVELGKILETDPANIWRVAFKMGFKKENRVAHLKREARHLKDNGVSNSEIALLLGKSVSSISGYLKETNDERRNKQ